MGDHEKYTIYEETADPETVREIEQEKAQKADTPSKKDIRKNTAPSDGI